MKKIFFPLVMVAVLALTACALPTGVGTTQPSSSDQAATVVAATMRALSTNTPAIVTPEAPAELLPHTLYYLGEDRHVFRMERDGKTITQLTFEEFRVTNFDVSPIDGSVVYVANNQLILVNADGSNPRVLVDAWPRENNPWITSPVFSPNGRTLAFGYKGLNLYDISSGVSKLVIEDQWTDPMPDSGRLPIETYSPVRYSPDGTKLLLALGHWESAPSHAVYYPDTNALVRYGEVKDYIYCCSFHGGPVWSPDSASFYGVASVHDTGYQTGELWRIDAGDGAVTRMLRTEVFSTGIGTVYLPKELYLAPDGHLYFFFGTYQTDSGYWDAPALNLVRSAPDGVTDRTVLRDENFRLLNEALWTPDASFVITATWPGLNWDRSGGVLELYYTDGQKSPVWLAPFGRQMKWGP